ncbi:alpha/beta fold hydrolase [Dactylosporangium sp. NPDC051541]|uniref:alpha/beta fold hydrolase n=1 Tax=Dactylosporangium sp. NPDC051541 TaxID=3363977 RepID=UPI0037B3A360
MQRIDLPHADVTLSCLLFGPESAPPVVLLHGLAGAASELQPTAAALAKDFRVVVPDQRGHGHSTRRPADVSRRAYVEDAAFVIRELCGGGPVSVAGQSMGGHTAMLLAAWHPHLVDRLVMLEAGVGGTAPDDDYPARLGTWFASWPLPFATPAAAVAFLGGTPTAHAWAADLEAGPDGLRPRFDADVMEAAIRPVAATARWPEWTAVTAPTWLIRGERGTCPPAEDARMRDLRPACEYRQIPDAGHDAHLDQPEAWLTLLREALTS